VPAAAAQGAARGAPAFDLRSPTLGGLIAQHGAWQRDKAALLCGDRRRSWGELDAATNAVANGLLAAGLKQGDRLAVLMHNSIEMVEVMFGAVKAGVCVVPLNLSVTDAAIDAMLADCAAAAIAGSGDQCLRLDRMRYPSALPPRLKLAVDAPSDSWFEYAPWRDRQPARALAAAVDADGECNIIYSSGTTSLPKGIVHTHRCRFDTACDLALALRYHSDAVVLSSLGLFSNISWVAMLCTMLTGATLSIMPSFSAAALAERIEKDGITHGVFVPVQLQRLMDLEGIAARDFSSLQTIMCCGSSLPPPLKQQVRNALRCDLIELYGLTEGLITTLAPGDFDRKLASVGKPLPGAELLLIDEAGRAVPPGQAGEIVGISRFLMSGYLNRPEATAEATWTDPTGRRWLRTGDIGRVDEEGFLYIVDRKKDMILSGGQNIYPADIEAVLREHPDVIDVAVIGIPSAKWGETPLAVVVPRAPCDAQALVSWTNERVGRQQRIAGVVLRDSLPRNPNGKILKRDLRDEYQQAIQ
jgi:acyl-CoA synthetase (AMP-forming)/AMP-acid ligase II